MPPWVRIDNYPKALSDLTKTFRQIQKRLPEETKSYWLSTDGHVEKSWVGWRCLAQDDCLLGGFEIDLHPGIRFKNPWDDHLILELYLFQTFLGVFWEMSVPSCLARCCTAKFPVEINPRKHRREQLTLRLAKLNLKEVTELFVSLAKELAR